MSDELKEITEGLYATVWDHIKKVGLEGSTGQLTLPLVTDEPRYFYANCFLKPGDNNFLFIELTEDEFLDIYTGATP